jgi:flagellar basal-body rod protein FlgB
MADISSFLSLHQASLAVQRQRMDVLASNLANADTPNYKARDIDFAKVLAGAQKQANGANDTLALASTNAGHATGSSSVSQAMPLAYRVPLQPSLDGNTVDEQVEQSAFADAALHYQASQTFLSGDVKGLMTAITGQ